MVRKPRKRISGLELQRFIYLISPNIIKKNFYKSFEKVLLFGNVKYFQLRLKKNNKANIIKIGNKVRQITKKYNVKLIINDDFNSCLKIKADGCHMGQLDGSIMIARKKFWLIPIILVLLIFGGLIVLTQGSAVAPFIYTIF